MIYESANFGADGCAETDTLGNDTVSETTAGDGEGLGATDFDCGVNSDGNIR